MRNNIFPCSPSIFPQNLTNCKGQMRRETWVTASAKSTALLSPWRQTGTTCPVRNIHNSSGLAYPTQNAHTKHEEYQTITRKISFTGRKEQSTFWETFNNKSSKRHKRICGTSFGVFCTFETFKIIYEGEKVKS